MESYTITYTEYEPLEIKPTPFEGPYTFGPIGADTELKGWVCPKCGRVNAPWVASCSCTDKTVISTNYTWTNVPIACKGCSNHPSNGGSGICNCTLGTPIIT